MATPTPTKTPTPGPGTYGYTPLGNGRWRAPDGRIYYTSPSGGLVVEPQPTQTPRPTQTPQPTMTHEQKAADKNEQRQADAAYATPTPSPDSGPLGSVLQPNGQRWIFKLAGTTNAPKPEIQVYELQKSGKWTLTQTLDKDQLSRMWASAYGAEDISKLDEGKQKEITAHIKAADPIPGISDQSNKLGGPAHAEPPTSDLSNPQPPDQLDPAEQQQILGQSRSQPAVPSRSQPSPSPAAGNIAGPPPMPVQHGGGFRNWTNPSGQNDFDPNQATYYSTVADKAHQAGAWQGTVGGAGGVATSPSQNYSYTPGFKMGGHMVIPGPATLYLDATGEPIAKMGEDRQELLSQKPNGSVAIDNHVPHGLRGFATGGTIDPSYGGGATYSDYITQGQSPSQALANYMPGTKAYGAAQSSYNASNPVATSGGNPPMADQPSQPAQSYSGLSFPGTTIGSYNLPGLNAGTIPSSPFSYSGSGSIPQGQDVNQLENQSYGYLSGLQNYKSGFDTNLQNTLAGINTARQDALTRMAGAEANEPARLAQQHLRDVYDPHYGMAGVAKPQEIAPPVGTFGTPDTPATTSGVGLRWQLQTPQEAYNRINQPLSEYESLIGKTASGVFSQITDAQDKARLIIAALKGENPSKPNPNGNGLVPSNFKDPNDASGGGGSGGGGSGTTAKRPAGPLQPEFGPNGPTGRLVPISQANQSLLPPHPYGFIPGTTDPAQPGQWANFPFGYMPPAGYHLVGGPVGTAPGMVVKD